MSQESEPRPTVPATPDATPPRTSRLRQIRLVALTVVLTMLVMAMVPIVLGLGPPTRDQLMERAGMKGKRELLIGVKDDQPGIAQSLGGGLWRGFDIDIAYMIAGYLEFERSQVVLLPIESEDRARRQAPYNGRFVTVDLVIASYSITEQREKEGATFSAPYLHTEQSVVTLASEEGPVSSLEDLRDQRVCTLTTSTSQARLREVGASPIGRNKIRECIQELYDGKVQAVTTDAAILAGFVTGDRGDNPFPTTLKNPKPLRHWDVGSSPQEKWGVNTGTNKELRDLVDLALYASAKDKKDRTWESAYDANLRWQQPFNIPSRWPRSSNPTRGRWRCGSGRGRDSRYRRRVTPARLRPSHGSRPRRMVGARQTQQWLLTLLPAFPLLLLVLRLWQLSRQDMSTMLLLVQYVSPLGLLSALLIALVWAVPVVVLVFGVLGRLLRLSAPDRFDPERSLLASGTARTPGWVLTAAVALAALTWQLRFLPTLLMLALWLLALRTRYLHPDQPTRILLVGVALPLAAAVVAYVVLGPAIWAAVVADEWTTAALLAVPPAATTVLTGPIPGWIAPALTHGLAYTVAGRFRW